MPGEFIRVCSAAAVGPGAAVTVSVGRAPFELAVCNVDGEFFAVENLCTHDDGPLGDGALDGYRIRCPRHDAYFDVRTGAALTLPAITPVDSFPTRVRDGDVEVEL